jgi:hypothetical protein
MEEPTLERLLFAGEIGIGLAIGYAIDRLVPIAAAAGALPMLALLIVALPLAGLTHERRQELLARRVMNTSGGKVVSLRPA